LQALSSLLEVFSTLPESDPSVHVMRVDRLPVEVVHRTAMEAKMA
jgi:hypothetical protein